ncbi:hypothetical protein ELQ35_20505 [Peribacillus cavernae]|uniref:Uncharacterized protein n=1 Tax=Peribacillus cavernae TaxID=1674310 RepID=A0A433HA35_9BACI|nr:hypothetical protein [Peribacillus cavernae]MDQ0219745.1 hypothetical protein [Peribacillus cavernae]RUQ25164.1 hypothetical protein ELQ35_20505 [Peribacillus cavernae]
MSKQKKEKVIHVDKLVIHAKDVEIIKEHQEEQQPRREQRGNPWESFFRRRDEGVAPREENLVQEMDPTEERVHQENQAE